MFILMHAFLHEYVNFIVIVVEQLLVQLCDNRQSNLRSEMAVRDSRNPCNLQHSQVQLRTSDSSAINDRLDESQILPLDNVQLA